MISQLIQPLANDTSKIFVVGEIMQVGFINLDIASLTLAHPFIHTTIQILQMLEYFI